MTYENGTQGLVKGQDKYKTDRYQESHVFRTLQEGLLYLQLPQGQVISSETHYSEQELCQCSIFHILWNVPHGMIVSQTIAWILSFMRSFIGRRQLALHLSQGYLLEPYASLRELHSVQGHL